MKKLEIDIGSPSNSLSDGIPYHNDVDSVVDTSSEKKLELDIDKVIPLRTLQYTATSPHSHKHETDEEETSSRQISTYATDAQAEKLEVAIDEVDTLYEMRPRTRIASRPTSHEYKPEEEETSSKQSNTFAAKKTVAQGMMDIALITANANQLRYAIGFTSKTSRYYLLAGLIGTSLILQVVVGITMIFKRRLDYRAENEQLADRINNFVLVSIFLVTVINVLIASFTDINNDNVIAND